MKTLVAYFSRYVSGLLRAWQGFLQYQDGDFVFWNSTTTSERCASVCHGQKGMKHTLSFANMCAWGFQS